MATKKSEGVEIQIMEVQQGRLRVNVVGTSPILLNRMSEKAKRQLLLPPKPTNRADRNSRLKHVPLEEFNAAPYKLTDDDAPTLLAVPGASFKRALASAALDIPGTNKSVIGRLTYVPNEYVPLYGIPKLYMTVVRSADINRTPDVRTLVIVPEWAASFDIDFVKPNLNEGAIANLIAASGIFVGVGDGRPEKGKLSFGRFQMVSDGDQTFSRIVDGGTREVQVAAMEAAVPYDSETASLLEWFDVEIAARSHTKLTPRAVSTAAPA